MADNDGGFDQDSFSTGAFDTQSWWMGGFQAVARFIVRLASILKIKVDLKSEV